MLKLGILQTLLVVTALLCTVTGKVELNSTSYTFEISENEPVGSSVEGRVSLMFCFLTFKLFSLLLLAN